MKNCIGFKFSGFCLKFHNVNPQDLEIISTFLGFGVTKVSNRQLQKHETRYVILVNQVNL